MKLTDLIVTLIEEMFNSDENTIEIGRNELANKVGCVPSQINYVITSRFTPEHGYRVESRRGGGGYIRITRIKYDKHGYIMHIVNHIGNSLDNSTAEVFAGNLYRDGLLSDTQVRMFRAALSDKSYADIPPEIRDKLRASLAKNLLISI